MHQDASSTPAAPQQRYTLRFERFSAFVEEYTSLLSLGGMFLKTEAPTPVGSVIAFDVKLTDGFRLFQGTGEVVWVRRQSAGPGRETGMGVRFQALDESGRELILKILEEQVKGGGEPFDVDEVPPDASAEQAPVTPQAPVSGLGEGAAVPPAGGLTDAGALQGSVMAALGGAGVAAGDHEFSEEATLVTQRGALGVGPSQGIEFATPWENLPDDVPVDLFDVGADDAVGAAGDVDTDAAAPSLAAPPPPTSPTGLENPFAMGETDFGDFDDLPDLDSDDDLVLESEADVQFDRTMTPGSTTAANIGAEAMVAPQVMAPSASGAGETDPDPAAASTLGAEFETGSEMALSLDDPPSSGTAVDFGSGDLDEDEEPTLVGSAASRGVEDMLAAQSLTANDGFDDGSSMDAFGEPGFEAPSEVDGAVGFEASPEVPPAMTAPTLEPYQPLEDESFGDGAAAFGEPLGAAAAPGAASQDDGSPAATAQDGLSTAPWSVQPPVQGEPAAADGDPFATHPPPPAGDGAAAWAPQPTHDSTEILEAAPAVAAAAAWGQESAQGEPPAAPVEVDELSPGDDMAAIHASPYGVQDYDLESPPPPSGWRSKLGNARWLLVSLALVLLVGAGYLFRHRLASLAGLDASDGNIPPMAAVVPETGDDTIRNDGAPISNEEVADGSFPEGGLAADEMGDGAAAVDGSGTDGSGRNVATDVVSPVGSETVADAAAVTTPQPPPPRAAPAAAPARRGAGATQVVDIRAQRASGGTEVVVQLDGDLDPSAVLRDVLAYNDEREQIRIVGLAQDYRQSAVAVGTSELEQIRTGWHVTDSGDNELRLVFDLAAPGLSTADYRIVGDRLVINVR